MYDLTDPLTHKLHVDAEDDSDEDCIDDGLPEFCASACTSEDRPLCVPNLACSKVARLIYFMAVVISIYFIYAIFFSNSHFADGTPKSPTFNLSKASNILGSLCAEYSKGHVDGSICRRLCTTPNYTIADLYDKGSKVVIKLQSEDKDNILKMEKAFFQNYEQLDPSLREEEFTNAILDIVNDRLQLGWPKDYKDHLMRKLWPGYKKGTLTPAQRKSIWALLSQDEFINLQLLQTSRVLPKILGSCGHIYQVEYLIPFRMKGYYMNLKAKILLHLVGTLKLFDEFLNEPLQFCDVKFENLGLSSDYPKRFVIMDSDMLYTESKLHNLLTSKECTTDSECPLFDCHSKCDTTVGYCTGRLNDNVDVFCKKLINKIFGNFWSKNNRYLAACHEPAPVNATKRLNDLRLVWAWNLADV